MRKSHSLSQIELPSSVKLMALPACESYWFSWMRLDSWGSLLCTPEQQWIHKKKMWKACIQGGLVSSKFQWFIDALVVSTLRTFSCIDCNESKRVGVLNSCHFVVWWGMHIESHVWAHRKHSTQKKLFELMVIDSIMKRISIWGLYYKNWLKRRSHMRGLTRLVQPTCTQKTVVSSVTGPENALDQNTKFLKVIFWLCGLCMS